jgi:predicted metalloprotease
VRVKIVAAVCAALLLTGCTAKPAEDPAAAAASEAAKAREAVPTTTPSAAPPGKVTAPPPPAKLTKNAIYRVGKLTAHCQEPKLKPTSVANVRSYYTQLTACLNAAWAPVIRKAGFTFTPPKLDIVAGKSADLPCNEDAYGIYCGETIYINAQIDLDYFREDPELAVGTMAFVIGHEYGHHVQALAGISEAAYERGLKLNGVDLALEETRRHELQASCFGGVFFGANRDFRKGSDWPKTFGEIVASTSDPQYDHGSAKNHARWSMAGFAAADPVACNTYAAPSGQVG